LRMLSKGIRQSLSSLSKSSKRRNSQQWLTYVRFSKKVKKPYNSCETSMK
jgi:hypothetical protein